MRSLSLSLRVAAVAAAVSLLLGGSLVPVAAASHPASNPTGMTRFGSLTYFAAETASHGRELWVTDGGPGGTHEVIDINPAGSSNPGSFNVINGILTFVADDGAGPRLWASDGTALGTDKIDTGGVPFSLTDVNGTLFFVQDDMVWISDGTMGGTDPVEALSASDIGEAVAFKGKYYLLLTKDAPGNDPWWLWKSDGTAEGTHSVRRLVPPGGHFEPEMLVPSGNFLYFILDDQDFAGGEHPASELWRSDGTSAGTKQVIDLNPDYPDSVDDLTNVAGTLFFTADLDGDRELWKSRGTTATTMRVADINASDSSDPGPLTRVGNRLFFGADDGSGRHLWRTKGTMASTVEIDDAAPFECGLFDFACGFVSVNYTPAALGSLYFFPSAAGGKGIELWVSDGTEPGTFMVKNINPGTAHSRPSDLSPSGSLMYFAAKDGSHGRELWVTNGT
ncbi:MAG TPA: hypothetical protein VIF08_08135, partial [Candidatus Limnocylindrales bacterium]